MAELDDLVEYPPFERHRRELAEQARARRLRLLIALPSSIALVFLLFQISSPLGLFALLIAVAVLFFLALPGSSSVDAGELSGIEGELAVLKQLKGLPDEYWLMNRVKLPDETLTNGQRELDFVVGGPTGLWVIEVKNTPGVIHVQPDQPHWPMVRRAGCGSSPSWNATRSPLPQVRAQVESLSRWLLRHGLDVRPRAAVVFAHPQTALEGAEHSSIPVLLRDRIAPVVSEAGPQALPPGVRQELRELRSNGIVPHVKYA
ncbi:nuclease-related domain-containing protein [Wenzhouxiangella marina]|uniref:Uncharacterized protein n=1 Tax=Wenzhouxiangella marina TaxID=1579979 RepID=A0A0K0XZ92_9GAMM|nr:nuclease-related domain-containing protein [Wenzhouxiangella marina]AKS42990.1 hypothetical protein WM2015_2632 [Wenzhouxiangella marina]MBB6087327.1 hypothetical protein [Wenzhouxiangella marina]